MKANEAKGTPHETECFINSLLWPLLIAWHFLLVLSSSIRSAKHSQLEKTFFAAKVFEAEPIEPIGFTSARLYGSHRVGTKHLVHVNMHRLFGTDNITAVSSGYWTKNCIIHLDPFGQFGPTTAAQWRSWTTASWLPSQIPWPSSSSRNPPGRRGIPASWTIARLI